MGDRMQYRLEFERRSEEEYIKDQGLIIDYDEIARKGKMSKEEALISKWYGVYQSRGMGDHMARIVVPGGKITSSQGRKIAEASLKYSKGLISVTTRQALQLHFLQVGILADLMRDVAEEGLTTFHGCGDVTRTIPACPLAETCSYARINVLPHAVDTMKYLTDSRDLDNLPRKLKFTFSGCKAGCGQAYMNCVGVVAVVHQQNDKVEKGFQIIIGGGMGWKAFVGQELFSFVPEHAMKDVARAVALLYREYGDRYNRSTSRLKFVVHRLGIDKCREIVLENLRKEKKSIQGILMTAIEEVGEEIPQRPLATQDHIGTDGTLAVNILIPKGEIVAEKFMRIAQLSEMYGNQKIYTTNRQNLAIRGVDPRDVMALKAEVSKLGFETEGAFGLVDIVCCVGKTYCPKAVSTTRDLFDLLLPVVLKEKYESIWPNGFINITGCPNSCSPYRIADIGFRGERIREELGSVEGYEVVIGGSEQNHGLKLGAFKTEDCSEVVETLLDYYIEDHETGEFIGDFFRRVGIDRVKEKVYGEV